MSKELCQRLCIDDLCRGGQTLCGAEFCEGCGKPVLPDETECDECYQEREEEQARFDADCDEDDREDSE